MVDHGLLQPRPAGQRRAVCENFANPIEREPRPARQGAGSRRLRRLLSPFLLRRTKSEVLTDLPPRTEIVHEVVPGAKERALLEALRQQAEASVAQTIAGNMGGGSAKGRTSSRCWRR